LPRLVKRAAHIKKDREDSGFGLDLFAQHWAVCPLFASSVFPPRRFGSVWFRKNAAPEVA
jgi:hypothetical protein